MAKMFRIVQAAPELPMTWAATEFLYWNQEVINILKKDANGKLLEAAYYSVDWEGYYEQLKGTPFYNWKERGSGFISLGGPAHIEENNFFSVLGDISIKEDEYLRERPEVNQVLHDLHVEAAEQMIDFILQHGICKIGSGHSNNLILQIGGNNNVLRGKKSNIDRDGQSKKTLHSRSGLTFNAPVTPVT